MAVLEPLLDDDSQLKANMTAVTRHYRTTVRRQRGRGDFIGGDTREEGAAAFRAHHRGLPSRTRTTRVWV